MRLFSKRKPFPLTDEEVIREALKTVTEYANRHPGEEFNINACTDAVMASVTEIWMKARGYTYVRTLRGNEQDECSQLVSRISMDLRARACIKATECLKNRQIQKINMSTAEALIAYELRQRGLKFFFEWQKLRVKVSIKLDCGSAMTFIVKYKDLREGKLLDILDTIMAIVTPLNQTKGDVTVWPLTGSWKTWNGWKS